MLLENVIKYNEYIQEHKDNVMRAYGWIKENIPDLIKEEWCKQLEENLANHDMSKTSNEEYEPYLEYFYGEYGKNYGKSSKSGEDSKDDNDSNSGKRAQRAGAGASTGTTGTGTTDADKARKVKEDFKYGWIHHIHNNPHHWQYWVLHHDDEPVEVLEMPDVYLVEMICDHWSFSWKSGDLAEIGAWYEKHKNMKLGPKTRAKYEEVIKKIVETASETAALPQNRENE